MRHAGQNLNYVFLIVGEKKKSVIFAKQRQEMFASL